MSNIYNIDLGDDDYHAVEIYPWEIARFVAPVGTFRILTKLDRILPTDLYRYKFAMELERAVVSCNWSYVGEDELDDEPLAGQLISDLEPIWQATIEFIRCENGVTKPDPLIDYFEEI